MADINAGVVKDLREKTGAGMMDCKKALQECGGDIEKAITILREKGAAVLAKRESKTASEGTVETYIHTGGKIGVLVELSCETDFVAKTDDFKELAKDIAMHISESSLALEGVTTDKMDDPAISEKIQALAAKLGEKMAARRTVKFGVASEGTVERYIHTGGKIGVLVELSCETDSVAKTDDFKELAKDIAMHVSWSNPEYLTREDIPAEKLEAEREVHKQWAMNQGKPEAALPKIVEGRMEKFFSTVVLMDQPFIKSEDQTIGELVKEKAAKLGEKMGVRRFVRFRVGEEG